MKKRIIAMVIVAILTLVASTLVFADNDIKVAIDGEYVEFDVPPQAVDGRTMVPLRVIFEELGAEVDWDNDTQTVTAIKNDITVTATIGSTKMYVDGIEKTMDVAPMAINGRTLVPVRFVAEAYGCDVDWNEKEKTVTIDNIDIVYDGMLTEDEFYEMYE